VTAASEVEVVVDWQQYSAAAAAAVNHQLTIDC